MGNVDFADSPRALQAAATFVSSTNTQRVLAVEGTCRFVLGRASTDLPALPLAPGYSESMTEFLPKRFARRTLAARPSEADLQWLDAWGRDAKVTITRQPTHGRMIMDPAVDPHPVYLPEVGFIGQDRVEALVSVKAADGRRVAKRLAFFINVVPRAELDSVANNPQQQLTRNCGTTKYSWPVRGTAARPDTDVVGVCLVGYSQGARSSLVSPLTAASTIANWRGEYRGPSAFPFEGADVRLVQAPSHGTLTADTNAADLFGYAPAVGYTGKDRAVFSVTLPAVPGAAPVRSVRVVYFIKVPGDLATKRNPDSAQARHCGARGVWRISQTTAAEPLGGGHGRPDLPATSAAAPQVHLVATPVTRPGKVLHVCDTVFVHPSYEESKVDMHFVVDANSYFGKLKSKFVFRDPRVSVIRQPKHGTVQPNPSWQSGKYIATPGFTGKDAFVVEVKEGAVNVKVHYFIKVTEDSHTPSCQGAAYVISAARPHAALV